MGRHDKLELQHTGGAVGGSSVLYIRPTSDELNNDALPQGIVVAILTNISGINLTPLAVKLANSFLAV